MLIYSLIFFLFPIIKSSKKRTKEKANTKKSSKKDWICWLVGGSISRNISSILDLSWLSRCLSSTFLLAHTSMPNLWQIFCSTFSPGASHESSHPGETSPLQHLWQELLSDWEPQCPPEDCSWSRGGGGQSSDKQWGNTTSSVLHLQQTLHHLQQHVPTYQGELSDNTSGTVNK